MCIIKLLQYESTDHQCITPCCHIHCAHIQLIESSGGNFEQHWCETGPSSAYRRCCCSVASQILTIQTIDAVARRRYEIVVTHIEYCNSPRLVSNMPTLTQHRRRAALRKRIFCTTISPFPCSVAFFFFFKFIINRSQDIIRALIHLKTVYGLKLHFL